MNCLLSSITSKISLSAPEYPPIALSIVHPLSKSFRIYSTTSSFCDVIIIICLLELNPSINLSVRNPVK